MQLGDIEQDAATQNRRHGIDREAPEAGGIGLERRGFVTPVQAAAAREMTQGIDVRSYMAPQGKGFGGGAVACRADVLAVPFHQREEEWRMAGVVRHAGEVGLGEIEDARAGKEIEQGSHSGSLQDAMSALIWSSGL